jgi:hypothetical protein
VTKLLGVAPGVTIIVVAVVELVVEVLVAPEILEKT